MRHIQTKVLPQDWLQKVSDFDLDLSSLNCNAKVIARRLIDFIEEEKKDSLSNPLARKLILHIVFKNAFLNELYDCVPKTLIIDGMNETKRMAGFHFTRKLHSVFIEFIIYKKLYSNGFEFKNITRTDGSCDLVMEKNSRDYNFEVKFKESEDTFKSRLFDIIDGMSLLNENSFLRGETYDIQIKSQNIDDNIQGKILLDIGAFISNQKEEYSSNHINIFNVKNNSKHSRDINKVWEDISSSHISQELTDENAIYNLIQKILVENNGHITKLIKKSKRIENFNGCLVWDVPFHKDIDCESAKRAFNCLKLDFDLYVFIVGVSKMNCDFFIPKQ